MGLHETLHGMTRWNNLTAFNDEGSAEKSRVIRSDAASAIMIAALFDAFGAPFGLESTTVPQLRAGIWQLLLFPFVFN